MKIAIVGASGVGKSTIAEALARHYAIRAYEFDDIYWDLTQAEYVKNTQEVMDHKIAAILKQDTWLVEGAYDKRMLPFFEDSSVILRVKIPRKKPVETWKNTLELLRFSKVFDTRLDRFFEENAELLNKLVVVEDTADCLETIDNLDCCGL